MVRKGPETVVLMAPVRAENWKHQLLLEAQDL